MQLFLKEIQAQSPYDGRQHYLHNHSPPDQPAMPFITVTNVSMHFDRLVLQECLNPALRDDLMRMFWFKTGLVWGGELSKCCFFFFFFKGKEHWCLAASCNKNVFDF